MLIFYLFNNLFNIDPHQDKADDFVLATGETHAVREFIEIAFQAVGINMEWEGEGVEEVGMDKSTRAVRVRIDPQVCER